MSGIWPVLTGHIPDIDFWCLGYGQFLLATFRTSNFDVRDTASFYWPYPGHQLLMSGIWTVSTVHIPDIKSWCPEYGQWKLSIFWTSTFDVWNMDRENCPYSGHQLLMSRTWIIAKKWCPEYGQWCLEHGQWCPEYGQWCLEYGQWCPE